MRRESCKVSPPQKRAVTTCKRRESLVNVGLLFRVSPVVSPGVVTPNWPTWLDKVRCHHCHHQNIPLISNYYRGGAGDTGDTDTFIKKNGGLDGTTCW